MTVWRFAWTTFLGGVIVILPVALAAAGLVKAVAVARGVLAPIEGWLPEAMHFRTIVAAAIVLGTFFLVGALVRTALGKAIQAAAERGLLERIPGYTLFRTLTRRLGGQSGTEMAVATVRMDDHDLIGLVMEWFADGRCAVFVPSSQTPAMGSLIIVPADRVRVLDIPMKQALGCLSQWGVGSAAALGGAVRK
jgi:uncharacterized membrane protein